MLTILSMVRRKQFDKDPQSHPHTANEALPTAEYEGSHEPTRKREGRLPLAFRLGLCCCFANSGPIALLATTKISPVLKRNY